MIKYDHGTCVLTSTCCVLCYNEIICAFDCTWSHVYTWDQLYNKHNVWMHMSSLSYTSYAAWMRTWSQSHLIIYMCTYIHLLCVVLQWNNLCFWLHMVPCLYMGPCCITSIRCLNALSHNHITGACKYTCIWSNESYTRAHSCT